MRVLVVDDDARVRDALEIGIALQWEDAHVIAASDGEAGLELFFNEEPDIVLLDVTMPRMNGFEVLKAIRQVSDVPVIMLTARGEVVDQVRGPELGADDYVAKPFSHLALMAMMKAALRCAELPPPVQALLDRVWGGDYDASPEYLKVFISRLRTKLRRPDGPEYIETERGRGYRFVRPRELAATA